MEVPKEKVPEEQTPKEEAPKREAKSKYCKYWWFGGAMAVLSALIIVFGDDIIDYLKRPPKIPPLSPKQKDLFDKAIRQWEAGSCADAIEILEELISIRLDYVDAYNIKGRVYVNCLKQYQNAIRVFRRGLKRDPNNKDMLYNLGLAYWWIGDLKQAIKWNQKALEQDPDVIIAIYNHAIYHVDYGEKYKDESYYDSAIVFYEDVISRNQEFAVSSMFNLAALYARLAKQESNKSTKDQYVMKAVELLDKAIEREGPERLKKVTGEISVLYSEDLRLLYSEPTYKAMIKKWKDRFGN